MNFSDFKNRLYQAIRYDDLDTYGHVNNKVFLSYLEEARIFYMKDVLKFSPKNMDFEAVVGRVDIRYKAPLFLFDDVWIYTRCSKFGSKSFDLEHLIIKKVDDKEIISAIATVTMVSYDLKKGVSKPNSQEMMEKVLDYETVTPLRS